MKTRNLSRIILSISLAFVLQAKAQVIPAATGSGNSKQDAQTALEFHNKIRKDVGVPPLLWSSELSAFAQIWANKLATEGCKLEHRPATGKWAQQYGENIYYGTANGLTLLDASKAWYAEIKDFNGDKLTMKNFVKVAHYTQMVWRTTTKLGMAKAVCPSGATIIVANYSPLGNYMGQKPY